MKTILIIEDDASIQKAYQEKLTKEGFMVMPAINYKEALSQLTSAPIPDCIILDIMLPGGEDGLEILSDIRQYDAWKGIPVLVLTNIDTEKERALSMGVAEYLIKSNTSIDQIAHVVGRLAGE